MEITSRLLQDAVDQIAKLPGIGKKTALRLALHLLKQDPSYTESLSSSLVHLRNEIQYCKKCHLISDGEICQICQNVLRDKKLLCLVEDSRDVIAIENTGQYRGTYHVLGGVISPLNGVGPQDLNIHSLVERVENESIEEVIMALSPTLDGDTTGFYIARRLKDKNIKVSTIARGIPIGSELEYMDEVTLGRSIISRTITE